MSFYLRRKINEKCKTSPTGDRSRIKIIQIEIRTNVLSCYSTLHLVLRLKRSLNPTWYSENSENSSKLNDNSLVCLSKRPGWMKWMTFTFITIETFCYFQICVVFPTLKLIKIWFLFSKNSVYSNVYQPINTLVKVNVSRSRECRVDDL